MKRIVYITGISLAVMILSACEGVFNKNVRGSGDLLSMEVELPAYDGLSITGTCNANLETREIPPLIPILAGSGTCFPTGINMCQSHFR